MANHEEDQPFDPEQIFRALGVDRVRVLDFDEHVQIRAPAQTDAALEAIGQHLPPLSRALESWSHESPGLLFDRETMLKHDQLWTDAILFMYEWLTENGEPFVLKTSPISLRNPQNKQDFLRSHTAEITAGLGIEASEENMPQSVRTVTLAVPGIVESPGRKPVLVTAATNDPFIDKATKVTIGKDFGLSAKKAKDTSINDPEFDAPIWLGMSPGIVCPFIPPGLAVPIKGFYYLQRDLPPTTPVEIAISPLESLVMRRGPFERMLENFMHKMPHRSFKTFPAVV